VSVGSGFATGIVTTTETEIETEIETEVETVGNGNRDLLIKQRVELVPAAAAILVCCRRTRAEGAIGTSGQAPVPLPGSHRGLAILFVLAHIRVNSQMNGLRIWGAFASA